MKQKAVFTQCNTILPLLMTLLAAACLHGAEAANVALNKPVKSFSSLGDESLLTDGPNGAAAKFWSNRAFAAFPDHRLYPEWIVVDLGKHFRINAVHLFPRADAPNAGQGFPEDFTIQTCAEGEPWTTVVEKKGYAQPTGADAQKFEFPPCVARFVKVEATRLRPVGGNLGAHFFQLAEVEVFGSVTEEPALAAPAAPAAAKLAPAAAANLRCEYRVDPVGIDAAEPHLSWTMDGTARGQKQTAYRVLVARSRAELDANQGTLWDSGKVQSDQSIAVEYNGQALGSGTVNFWKVMLWDKDGAPTAWSRPARFVMGKLQPADWKGQWIGAGEDPKHAAVYLRKEVEVSKPVRRATAFFCGLGWSELYIDGKKASDWVLSPGNTCYHVRTQYLAFDVTEHFAAPGRKALGVILGDGWYALEKDPWVHKFEKMPYVDKPKLLLNIELEFADGSKQTIVSDETWKWSYGPITKNWVALEHIDLRKALPGWEKPVYDDSAWSPAALVKGPAGKLVAQKEPPTRVIQTIRPQRLAHDPKTETYSYEFGREFQGWVRFRASGPAGTAIKIIVQPPKRRPQGQNRGYTNQFILAGNGVEEYSPRFNYNSVSIVDVQGVAQPPRIDDLVGCHVNADLTDSGQFRCSDDTVNWLNESVRRTELSWVVGVPNDPTREKKGWPSDIYNVFLTSACLFDSQTLFDRWLQDVVDGQAPNGNCPCVTPGPYFDAFNAWWLGGSVVWGPWHWYQVYGDRRILVQSYPAMKRYLDFLTKASKDGIVDWGLGEWLSVEQPPPPRPLTNTAGYYFYARLVSQSAALAGHPEDARTYAALARTIQDKFNAKFLDRASGRYIWFIPKTGAKAKYTPFQQYAWPDPKTSDPVGSQGAQALALGVGLVPDEVRKQAEDALLAEIAKSNGFLSTGFIAAPHLLDVLARLDPQVGHEMTMKRSFPSWYGMTVGANNDVLNEVWTGSQVLMPSLGCGVAKWHFCALAGILPDESGPGFKKFIIRPNVVGDLHWVRCHYDSVHGRIESNWQRRGRQFIMDVTVPANTTATVFIPTTRAETILESGKPLAQADGVQLLRAERERAVLSCAAGAYHFTAALPARGTREGASASP
ncbi:MAG: family 78 glycoside hydrolase catalytic domain [Thermoguttaceae bacterium]|jgi:alpha-L-rhamnosidase